MRSISSLQPLRHSSSLGSSIVVWITPLTQNRIVLFSIALASPYSLTHPAVGYLLIEFPLILFFGFVSLFVITWSIVGRNSIDESSNAKWVRMSRLLAVVFLTIVFGMLPSFTRVHPSNCSTALFILLIILFNTVVDPPTTICRGSILSYNSDAAFAMVMSYRAIFSTFAFILGKSLCLKM